MSRHTLDGLLFKKTKEVILLLASLLLCQLARKPLQLHGTRVTHGVDRMANAIDQSGLVISLPTQHAIEISVDFIGVLPVLDVLLQVVEHVYHLNVGATMKRTLERAYASRDT